MKVRLIEKEICPRCRKQFICGKSGKCWCYAVDVPTGVLDKINASYGTCLCPDCLRELSARKTDSVDF